VTTALSRSYPNLLDYLKQRDPQGGMAQVVEYLTRRSTVLEDMPMKEGNLTTGERVSGRTSLPSEGSGWGWTRINEGVAPGKSTTRQVDEPCGMLNGLSKVDSRLIRLNGGPAFRLSEDKAFMAAMKNDVERGTFYHSVSTTPQKFTGFFPRLDATSGNEAATQIIKHTSGASGNDQTSILMVVWGFDTVYGFFPQGSTGGLVAKDLGEELVSDGDGGEYPAYRTWFDWSIGLAVRDWRYVARVCNIDTSALSLTADDIIPKMIDAYYRLQDTVSGDCRIYCNRYIQAALHRQARAAVGNSSLSLAMVEGKEIVTFMGHPIRLTDGIVVTESVVS
jgi:hypothetical protein